MTQIDILCNDKIYTEMLCLELEAQGYTAFVGYTGYGDILLCEKGLEREGCCITFSENGDADLKRPFEIPLLLELIEVRSGDDNIVDNKEAALYVSTVSAAAVYRGDRIILSELEHRILLYLYERKNEYVSQRELAEHFFGDQALQNPLRVYISYLRNKLDEAFGVKFIYTARGKGYMLKIQ